MYMNRDGFEKGTGNRMLKRLMAREAMLESALLQRIANQSALQSIAPWLVILHAFES